MFIHNKYGSSLNLSTRQIKQAVSLSIEGLCNKRKIIHEYLKGDICLDQACKKLELITKGKCQACVPYKRRKKFRGADGKPFYTEFITKIPISLKLLPDCYVSSQFLGATFVTKGLLLGFDVYREDKYLIT